jgi:cytochrome c biogenesis protein CcmG/thiol:disulfide interchange protein DsbE
MTNRRLPFRTLLVVASLALVVVACGSTGSSSTPAPGETPVVVGGSPLLRKPAPPIELQDLSGETVSLGSYQGRPVVVNFWASWCVPCRDEFPVFVDAREQHADAGLEILGVVYKDNAANAQRFADDQGAEWPLLQDPGEKVYNAYLGFGVPISVFIDPAGIVQGVSYGPLSEEGFQDQLDLILPATDGSPAPVGGSPGTSEDPSPAALGSPAG